MTELCHLEFSSSDMGRDIVKCAWLLTDVCPEVIQIISAHLLEQVTYGCHLTFREQENAMLLYSWK